MSVKKRHNKYMTLYKIYNIKIEFLFITYKYG